MNKRGGLGLAIISTIMVFIIGMMMINFLMSGVTTFRADLNCADASDISDATKLTCLVGDATIPYFVLIVFSLAIGAITTRMRL